MCTGHCDEIREVLHGKQHAALMLRCISGCILGVVVIFGVILLLLLVAFAGLGVS